MNKSYLLPLLAWYNYYRTALIKWQYMAVAGAGAGAELMDKGGAGAENKQFQLRNTVNT